MKINSQETKYLKSLLLKGEASGFILNFDRKAFLNSLHHKYLIDDVNYKIFKPQ